MIKNKKLVNEILSDPNIQSVKGMTMEDTKILIDNAINTPLHQNLSKQHQEQMDDDSVKYYLIGKNVFQCILQKEKGRASEIIVDEVKKEYNIYTTRNDDRSEIWIYHDGIYIPQGRTYINEFVRKIMVCWE